MATAPLDRPPPVSRESSWIKMLEAERNLKMSRATHNDSHMDIPAAHTPFLGSPLTPTNSSSTSTIQSAFTIFPPRQSSTNTFPSHRSASPVAISIPPQTSGSLVRVERSSQGSQTLVLRQLEGSNDSTSADAETEEPVNDGASSICHSPSWDDYHADSKRKREKKQQAKELQKALEKHKKAQEKQQREDERARKKAERAAPQTRPRRLSKLQQPLRESLAASTTEAVALHPLTSHPTSKPSTTTFEPDARQTFVGGLKLQLMHEANVRDNIRRQSQDAKFHSLEPSDYTINPQHFNPDQPPARHAPSPNEDQSYAAAESNTSSESSHSLRSPAHSDRSHEHDEALILDSDDEEDEDIYHSFLTDVNTATELPRHEIPPIKPPALAALKSSTRMKLFRKADTASRPKTGDSKPPLSHAMGAASKPRPSMSRSRPSSSSSHKADRILGEMPPLPTVKGLPLEKSGRSIGSSISSASFTDHSEYRNSDEYYSGITTPTSSRPQSRAPKQRLAVDRKETTNGATRALPEVPTLPLSATLPGLHQFPNVPRRLNEIKPSLPRAQSTPVLLKEDPKDLSFLPELKHQALTRPHVRSMATDTAMPAVYKGKPMMIDLPAPGSQAMTVTTGAQSPSSAYLRDARLAAPRLHSHGKHGAQSPKNGRSSLTTPSNTPSATPAMEQPMAKMFVICCHCKFWHDLPSKIYEAMCKAPEFLNDEHLGVSGAIRTMVACPWCSHGMSTECCAGYTAIVALKERFH